MAEQAEARNPMEEMIKLWQAWMTAGMDAMQRTASVFASEGGLPGWTADWRDQMEKVMRAVLEAARIPSAQDLQRVVQALDALRSNVAMTQAGLAALESVMKGQQEMWRALEGSVQQATRSQQEMQQSMATWSKNWEERIASMARGMEEWRERWDAMLRQGMAMSQTSQKNLEDLTKTMWDLSKKMMGGQG